MARLAVVVPVYQAEAALAELLAELTPHLAAVTEDWEIWLVDDGSADASWSAIASAAAADHRVRGLRLIRNFGEHVAITAGLDRVDADFVVIMACDLQDDPAAIPAMVAAAERGAELVLVRRVRRRDAWLKRLLARLFYEAISFLVYVNYDYRVGNFRLLTRRAVDYFRQHRERTRNVNAIMALMRVRTAYVDATHRPRRHGRSTYTLGRSTRMALSVIVGYSDIPLLVSGAVGGVLLIGALTFGAWLAVRPSSADATPDLAAIAALVAGIGGLIMVNFGIVGAYLGRAVREVKERPMYFISDSCNTSRSK